MKTLVRRICRVVVLAAVLGATLAFSGFAPAARAAGDDFVFTGRGWGHGVGLSQWGAWQAAREGVPFNQILAFYYPGAKLEPMTSVGISSDRCVTVHLSANPPTSSVVDFVQVDLKPTVTGATLFLKSAAGDQTEALPAGDLLNVFNQGGKIQVVTASGPQGPFDYIELRPTRSEADRSDGRVALQTKTSGKVYDYREYWGSIRVQPSGSTGLQVYNLVPVDRYVSGIGEVDLGWANPKWPGEYALEAVKTQAVATRSYALAKNATLTDGWQDQYYAGYRLEGDSRYPALAEAAQATAGLILTYNGKPASAYASAHSGGYTTDSAWSGSVPPYIVAKADPWSLKAPPTILDSAGPGYSWTFTISRVDLSAKFDLGAISRVEVIARDTADPASHAKTIRLTGSKGATNVAATTFKSRLGLKSTLILSVTGGEPLALGEFYDVGRDYIYHDQIARVVTAGLMSGYGDGSFGPDASITRWQFAKIAVNLHNLMYPQDRIEVVNVTTAPFADVPPDTKEVGDCSDWVAAAKKAGLVRGVTTTTFNPYEVVRRDQMATMMCRALGWEEAAKALPAHTPSFADVPYGSTHWAMATYVKVKEIILGYPGPTGSSTTVLRVEEPIKRQHVALILCRVLDLPR